MLDLSITLDLSQRWDAVPRWGQFIFVPQQTLSLWPRQVKALPDSSSLLRTHLRERQMAVPIRNGAGGGNTLQLPFSTQASARQVSSRLSLLCLTCGEENTLMRQGPALPIKITCFSEHKSRCEAASKHPEHEDRSKRAQRDKKGV